MRATSHHTDAHVVRLLRATHLYTPRFAADVQFTLRAVWAAAMASLDTPLPDPRMRDPSFVLGRLRLERTYTFIKQILSAKRAYLQQRGIPPRGTCGLLTCSRPGDAFHLNGLGYCGEHAGLALFHGLRHTQDFCHTCLVWNLMALKTLGQDPGHLQYYENTMVVA